VKKFIFTLNFVFLLTTLFLHAMKTEKTELTYLLRKESDRVKIYHKEASPNLSFSELYTNYLSLTEGLNRKFFVHRSDEFPMLHRVALLPENVHQKIFSYMFGGDEDAALTFYNKPILEAFQLYHEIKKKVAGDRNIACLYKMRQEKRDMTLQAINLWNSPVPMQDISGFISEDSDEIDEEPGFCNYLAGKEVMLMPDYRECSPVHVCVCGIGCTIMIFAGATIMGGVELLCSKGILETGLCTGCCLGPMWWAWKVGMAAKGEDMVDKKKDSFI
jgi:hypothetical protein